MASFTDTPYKFSPYISTQPVEAMVKVGMFKQGQYDENVQKIRDWIDSTSALPVSRDVDKQYLQSALNSAGEEINKLGNADFAEQQLTNSIGGMISKISKDPNMLAAVQSTMHNQKQATIREELFKQGKTSASNDDDYATAYGEYLNSTDLGRVFNHSYTPFTDVKKKALDVIKALHPNLQAFDMPYEELNGLNTGKIAAAMKRYKVEGISEGQIETALRASLDPNDMNQLRIDAKYQFKQYTPENLAQVTTNEFVSQKRSAEQSIKYLTEQKAVYIGNQEKQKLIDADIEYNRQLLGKDGQKGILEENYEERLKSIANNPDNVKFSLYKEGFIKQFSNAFKWSNKEESLIDNPIREQMNKDRAYSLDVDKHLLDKEYKEKNFDLEIKKSQIEAMKLDFEMFGLGGKEDWTTVGNSTIAVLESAKNYKQYVSEVDASYKQYEDMLISQGYNNKQIKELLTAYEENPRNNTINPMALGVVQNMLKLRDYSTALKDIQVKIRKEAEAATGYKDFGKNGLVGKSDYNFELPNGNSVKLSPQEGYDLYLKLKPYLIKSGDLSTFGTVNITDVRGLTPKQKEVIQNLNGVKGYQLNSVGLKLNKEYGDIHSKYGEVVKATEQKENELLSPYINQFVPRLKGVYTKDGGIPPSTASAISRLATSADLQSIAADNNTDLGKISEYLSSKNIKDTRVFVQNAGDKYEIWIKNESSPEDIQKLRVSASQVNTIFGPKYIENNTEAKIRMGLGRGNTNLTANPSKSIMKSQNGDFPNISKLIVTGDLGEDLTNPGLFIPYINVKKKNGSWLNVPLIGKDGRNRVGYEQGLSTFSKFNDELLIKLIQDSYPNVDISELDY